MDTHSQLLHLTRQIQHTLDFDQWNGLTLITSYVTCLRLQNGQLYVS
jgi:hypothetical protein